MDKLKSALWFLLLLVLSCLVIAVLFPTVHPSAGLTLPLTQEAVVERTRALLDSLGIAVSGLTSTVQLKFNRALLQQAQQEMGFERTNELVRGRIPAYVWEVRWTRPSTLAELIRLTGSGEQERTRAAMNLLNGDLFFRMDIHGGLLEFERTLADTVQLPHLSFDEARKLADDFVHHFSMFRSAIQDTGVARSELSDKRRLTIGVERPQRTYYEFSWSAQLPELNNDVAITVGVAGDFVSRYKVDIKVPERYTKYNLGTFHQITVALIYVGLCIALIIFSFKRFRAYEIGFRAGLIVGIVAALAQGIRLYMTLFQEGGFEVLLSVILGPLFTGGALLLIWAASESSARESFKEQFVPFDLVVNGYIFHSRVGMSVIQGIALGTACFAWWLVLVKAAGLATNLWIYWTEDTTLPPFSTFSPTLYVLTDGLFSPLFFVALMLMFFLSFLRRKIATTALFIAIGSFVIGLLNREHVQPLVVGILIETLIAVVIVWAFYRFDLVTAFITLATYALIPNIATLLNVGNLVYAQSGYTIAAVLVALFVGSTATLWKKNEISDFSSITPSFARNITERQRLQQELEIARRVQKTFLPKHNPRFHGLDIASRCAPALEVGGDYYDFIQLSPRRLGVAIGDVSGKGTQAAFYMTLTKGFLRALASSSESPAAVLTEANKLFYDNVERGAFISMVYGVFDAERRELTLARAGHNPVIMRKPQSNDVEIIRSSGLALGLEQGETFAKTIQEVTVPFAKDDLFVFYTDGFTEAMNKENLEFGEQRLRDVIQQYSNGTAQDALEGVFKEMKNFIGRIKQHDDMTMVVVKVTGD